MLPLGRAMPSPTVWRLVPPRVDFPPCIGQAAPELRRTLRHSDTNWGCLGALVPSARLAFPSGDPEYPALNFGDLSFVVGQARAQVLFETDA